MPDISSFQLLGLGPATGNWFMRMATYAKQQADVAVARSEAGPRSRGNAVALRDLAQKLEQMRFNAEDPIAILGTHIFHLTGRHDSSQPYEPSETARLVFHRVGQEQSVAWTDFILAVFAAEVKDMVKTSNRVSGELASVKQGMSEITAARDSAEQRLATERAARLQLEGEAARLTAELDQARAAADYFMAAMERGDSVSEAPAPELDPEDQPTAAQFEEALDQRRVRIADGLYLERRDGDTWYRARVGQGWHWLGSATDGLMGIKAASEARDRIVAARESV